MYLKGLFFLSLLVVGFSVYSQDIYLENLMYNSVLQSKNKENNKKFKKIVDSNFVYIIDTLSLPFIDDFSKNKQKQYNASTGDANVTAQIWIKFKVNNTTPDSISYMLTPTYTFDTAGGKQDTIMHPFFEIDLYYDITHLQTKSFTDTVWPPYHIFISSTDTDTVWFSPDVFLTNLDSVYTVADDKSLWIDEKTTVYVNGRYGVNPITYGVATFDGVNELGEPYDFSSEATHGIADYLTSTPINLVYLPSDSIVLSFYYQPQGLGDNPEKEDSLVLEFYSPSTQQWYSQWQASGTTLKDFAYKAITIQDTLFLKKGFQFRFKNYATLSGNVDHWHIDYVYLDKSRKILDKTIKDFGIQSIGSSFIKNYTTMPWEHYKMDNTLLKYTTETFDVVITNLSDITVNNKENRFFVYNADHTSLIQASNPNAFNILGFPPTSDSLITHKVNQPAPENDFQFPVDNTGLVREKFVVDITTWQNTIAGKDEINPDNDTISFTQNFDTYYSYDDGSAEKLFYLVGFAGTKVAQRFTIDVADTLKAVLIHFPKAFKDITQNTIQIMVWSSIAPETKIYESGLVTPLYDGNEFIRYELDEPLVVSGQFYVGLKQINDTKVYIGFDANNERQENIFTNVNGSWNTPFVQGSLMIRADFGTPEVIMGTNTLKLNKVGFSKLYPNPAKESVTVLLNQQMQAAISIFDISGRLIKQEKLSRPTETVSLSDLVSGVYFITITDTSSGQQEVHKLVISK